MEPEKNVNGNTMDWSRPDVECVSPDRACGRRHPPSGERHLPACSALGMHLKYVLPLRPHLLSFIRLREGFDSMSSARTAVTHWTRRLVVRALVLSLALAGLVALGGGRTPSEDLGRTAPVAVTTNQVAVPPAADGLGLLEQLRQQHRLQHHQGPGRRTRLVRHVRHAATSTSTSTTAGGRAPATATAGSSPTRACSPAA